MKVFNKLFLTFLYIVLTILISCNKAEIEQNEPITPGGVSTITTLPASKIETESSVIGGFIALNGDVPVIESGICYDSLPNTTISNNRIIRTVPSDSFFVSLTGLKPSTTFYFKAYLKNSKGIKYGNELTFKTSDKIIADTAVGNIKRIEESYQNGNPNLVLKNRDYTFFYDNSNRVIKIGIRSHSPIGFDTATTLLYYHGVSRKPYMIITPDTYSINPVMYDTVYFSYNSASQIIKDSTNESGYLSTTIRVPTKRVYSYPNSTTTIVHWYSPFTLNGPQELLRADTINNQSGEVMTQFYGQGNSKGNYATTNGFTYSNFINPLARLNIGGTIYSLIYKPISNEIFGNSAHKAVHNSNVISYYLDFYSQKIPKSFFIGGFTNNHFMISAQADLFTITFTPLPNNVNYPSKIEVEGRTALSDRKFIYKYFYY